MCPEDSLSEKSLHDKKSRTIWLTYIIIIIISYIIFLLISDDFLKRVLILLDYLITAIVAIMILNKDYKKTIDHVKSLRTPGEKLDLDKGGSKQSSVLSLPLNLPVAFMQPVVYLFGGAITIVILFAGFSIYAGSSNPAHVEPLLLKFAISLFIAGGSVYIFSDITSTLIFDVVRMNLREPLQQAKAEDDPSRS